MLSIGWRNTKFLKTGSGYTLYLTGNTIRDHILLGSHLYIILDFPLQMKSFYQSAPVTYLMRPI